MSKTTKSICTTAMGIALYVALSMLVKIPVIGHIGLDLGYIVLAVYCYLYGPVTGAIVGAAGCTLVSLLASGWFPIGWLLGNAVIGWLAGERLKWYKTISWKTLLWTVVFVFLGVFIIKTGIECVLYSIPLVVKMPKNAIAATMDAIVMCIGVSIAPRIKTVLVKYGYV